jgi:hypothetical protein
LLILFKCSVMQLIQLNWTTLIHFHASYALSQTSNYVKRPGCIASELHFSSLQVLLTHFWPPILTWFTASVVMSVPSTGFIDIPPFCIQSI